MERTIQAPEWERGTKDQVCAFLGIRDTAWDALLAKGRVPRGVGPNRSNLTWHWMDVVAVSWLLPFLCKDLGEES